MKHKSAALHGAVFLCYFFLAVLFTYPGILRMNTHIIGDGGDTLEYFSYFSIIKENLSNHHFPLAYTPLYRYPYGLDPSLSDARMFVLLGGLLSLIGSDVFIYNSLLLVVLTFNAFCAYWLSWLLTRNAAASFVGGLLFGFSFWVLSASYGSLSKVLLFGFPLLGVVVFRIGKGDRSPKLIYLIALTLYVISLSSVTLLQQVTVLIVVVGIACLVLYRRLFWAIIRLFTRHFPHALVAGVGMISLIIFTFFSHFSILFSDRLDSGGIIFPGILPPNPLMYIYPSDQFFSPFIFNFIRGLVDIQTNWEWYYSTYYIGLPAILLLLFALFISRKSKKTFVLMNITASCVLITQLIYVPSVYEPHNLPPFMFYSLQYLTLHADYFMVSFWFFASLSIAMALHVASLKKWAFGIIVLLLTLERLSLSYPIVDIHEIRSGRYIPVVQEASGSAVLDIPINVYTGYNLLPFLYGKPIMGGMLHWFGDSKAARSYLEEESIARFSCNEGGWDDIQPLIIDTNDIEHVRELNWAMAAFMKTHDVKTVVLHKERLDREQCRFVKDQLLATFSDLTSRDLSPESSDHGSVFHLNSDSPSFIRIFSDDKNIVYQLE